MMARFEMKLIQDAHGIWILEIIGNVDCENFQLTSTIENSAIVKRLTEVQAQTLVVDLSAAEQFDSLGLQLLLVLHKQLASHHIQIVLRQPNAHLRRVLRIMQFDRVFRVEAEDNHL